MRATCSFLLVALIGVGGGCGGGGDDDMTTTPVTLAFTEPAAGAMLTRDVLEPGADKYGIDIEVVQINDYIESINQYTAGAFDGYLVELGATTITATAKDAAGAPLATATVDVDVVDPELATCRDWLDHYGVVYTVGPANQGVGDPVTVTTPINGMPFRYLGNTSQRAKFFMDCTLARSLVEAAPHWRSRGIVEVQDIGVYNYRCIGTGTPPNCPSGMSQHAYAKAIDLARFVHADGTTYTVETDWVIDPDSEDTCTAPTEDAKDGWLHQVICALKAADVWTIALTPNYNAAHRDHFHVDLTAGSDFITKLRGALDVGPDDE